VSDTNFNFGRKRRNRPVGRSQTLLDLVGGHLSSRPGANVNTAPAVRVVQGDEPISLTYTVPDIAVSVQHLTPMIVIYNSDTQIMPNCGHDGSERQLSACTRPEPSRGETGPGAGF